MLHLIYLVRPCLKQQCFINLNRQGLSLSSSKIQITLHTLSYSWERGTVLQHLCFLKHSKIQFHVVTFYCCCSVAQRPTKRTYNVQAFELSSHWAGCCLSYFWLVSIFASPSQPTIPCAHRSSQFWRTQSLHIVLYHFCDSRVLELLHSFLLTQGLIQKLHLPLRSKWGGSGFSSSLGAPGDLKGASPKNLCSCSLTAV